MAGKSLAREFGVRVAKQDGVDADHFGELGDGVLTELADLALLEAGVRNGNDELRALADHFRHVFLGHFDHRAGRHLAFEVRLVPLHDLRRDEADHADLEVFLRALGIDEFPIEDDVGLESRGGVGAVFFAVGEDHVGAHVGELGAGDGALEEVEPEVEFVVAEVGSVILQRVHDLIGRVRLAALERADLGHHVAERVALQEVAVVKEQAVRRFGTCCLDQRNGARDGPGVAGPHTLGKCQGHLSSVSNRCLIGGPQAARSCRAITRRCTTLVPSPIVTSLTSRKNFSAG